MGFRRIVIKQSVAESIAEISWYLESEGLLAAAEKFSDDVYDFIAKLADHRKGYRPCRDPERDTMGYKCISYKKNIPSHLLSLIQRLLFASLSFQKEYIGNYYRYSPLLLKNTFSAAMYKTSPL